MDDKLRLIALRDVGQVEGWPHSPWVTGNEIRKGRLGCVRHGRRIYVTAELLAEYIARHTVRP